MGKAGASFLEDSVRRARLVFAFNSDWYALVPAPLGRVRIGQESKSAQNGPCEKSRPDFSLPDGRLEFSNLARSLAAMWDRFPVWIGPESAQNGSVAYQVLKVEISNFQPALELSPARR